MGTSKSITITNENGRLNKEEIEKLIKEAEKSKFEDEILRKKIEEKNQLENYCYSVRNTINDNGMKDKINDSDKSTLLTAIESTLKWIE